MKKYTKTFIITLLSLIISCGSALAAEKVTLHTNPDHLTIGTTYDGTTLSVSGTVPAGSNAVIRIMGEHKDTHFKKKGKALGFLWMNLGSVELHDVPNLFLIGADSKTYASGGAAWQELNLGFNSVKGQTDQTLFDEYIKLVSHEGLYEIQENVVNYSDAGNGLRNFSATMKLPSSLKKGAYTVEAAAVRGNKVLGIASTTINAKLDGFPKILESIAFGHEIAYGVSAVVIAILAGLLMTMLFQDKGGVH
ncbi:TIGR02186 family protein [Maridesulfovibrio sp.]|uniref:TIGR02186 family protein n=1 Tax=Maridesulfovibrio sp. TaxID=2795000 RepID=UPI0029F50FAC|nr:TIGR02186 family protein [Maridesulfovibrio sp.]